MLIGRQDDASPLRGYAENSIADSDRRAVKVAADAFAPVLFAGREVVARNDAAIAPYEQQIAGDDGRRNLRDTLLESVDFLRR